MRNFDDNRISFPVPEGWKVHHDPSGNIVYMDPSDAAKTWCFVQLGGLRPRQVGNSAPSARKFLAECYASELKSGAASLFEVENDRVVVEWPEFTTHGGADFIVYHFHLASNTDHGEIQLADFALAVPKAMKDSPMILRLQEMVREQTRLAKFHRWRG